MFHVYASVRIAAYQRMHVACPLHDLTLKWAQFGVRRMSESNLAYVLSFFVFSEIFHAGHGHNLGLKSLLPEFKKRVTKHGRVGGAAPSRIHDEEGTTLQKRKSQAWCTTASMVPPYLRVDNASSSLFQTNNVGYCIRNAASSEEENDE